MMMRYQDNVRLKPVLEDKWTAFEVIDGVFKGTVFAYGELSFDEDEDEDENKDPVLHFDIKWIENPLNLSNENQEFVQFAGNLLVEIITDQVEAEIPVEDRSLNSIGTVEGDTNLTSNTTVSEE